MTHHFFKAFLPIAALGGALGLGGCDSPTVVVGGVDGVPLAELDQSGPAPTKLVLGGPDKVSITEGDELAIAVSGDAEAIESLRFTLEDGTLGIARERGDKARGVATIAVTMPPADRIILAGSGDIAAPALVGDAEVVIAGSGRIGIARIEAQDLDVNVMGSGTLTAAGTADTLNFNVAGSGKLAAAALKAGRAEINIAGSGGGEFASDGEVEARIAGSGEVTVTGAATCSVSKLGSGAVRCARSRADAAGE